MLRAEVAELKPVKAIIGSKSLRSRGRGRAYLTALVHFNNLASNQFDHTIETILPLLVDGSAMMILIRSRGRGRAYLTALVHFNNLASNQFDHTIETILPLLVDGSAMIITRKLNAEWSKEYHG